MASENTDWEMMTFVKLKGELKRRGLNHTGKRDDLVKRLKANEANPQGAVKDSKMDVDDADKDMRLPKTKFRWGYEGVQSLRTVIINPFHWNMMKDKSVASWIEQSYSTNIKKSKRGQSAAVLQFKTIDSGDACYVDLKEKLKKFNAEIYHPAIIQRRKVAKEFNDDEFEPLVADQPKDYLYNRVLVIENIPAHLNVDEKLVEIFPEAYNFVCYQYTPECKGIAILEFFSVAEMNEFFENSGKELDIDGATVNIYKYAEKEKVYEKVQSKISLEESKKEISEKVILTDSERLKLVKDINEKKKKQAEVHNASDLFGIEKLSKFRDMGAEMRVDIKRLALDTKRRVSLGRRGAKAVPEALEDMNEQTKILLKLKYTPEGIETPEEKTKRLEAAEKELQTAQQEVQRLMHHVTRLRTDKPVKPKPVKTEIKTETKNLSQKQVIEKKPAVKSTVAKTKHVPSLFSLKRPASAIGPFDGPAAPKMQSMMTGMGRGRDIMGDMGDFSKRPSGMRPDVRDQFMPPERNIRNDGQWPDRDEIGGNRGDPRTIGELSEVLTRNLSALDRLQKSREMNRLGGPGANNVSGKMAGRGNMGPVEDRFEAMLADRMAASGRMIPQRDGDSMGSSVGTGLSRSGANARSWMGDGDALGRRQDMGPVRDDFDTRFAGRMDANFNDRMSDRDAMGNRQYMGLMRDDFDDPLVDRMVPSERMHSKSFANVQNRIASSEAMGFERGGAGLTSRMGNRGGMGGAETMSGNRMDAIGASRSGPSMIGRNARSTGAMGLAGSGSGGNLLGSGSWNKYGGRMGNARGGMLF